MSRNNLESTIRQEDGCRENPTTERALAFIRQNDPELMQVMDAHSQRAIHHTQAAWSTEPATLSYDQDGAAVEVMNQDSAAFRIFEAMRDAVKDNPTQEQRTQAARELVHMMSEPYRSGLGELPPERDALRERIRKNLRQITEQASHWLAREASAQSLTGEKFCDQTETMAGISRDLQHAQDSSQPDDFDHALIKKNPGLWESIRYGAEPPDIFPAGLEKNPAATELLDAYSQTTP